MFLNLLSVAIFTIFLWSSSRRTKKSIYKRKKDHESANGCFIVFLLLFYDLKYINSTKNRFANKKIGHGAQSNLILDLKINIVTKIQVSIFKNDKVRGGV